MKQHITIEQLQKLSEDGKKRLREWWKPRMGDVAVGYYYKYDEEGNGTLEFDSVWVHDEMRGAQAQGKTDPLKDGVQVYAELNYPLLSIGQMIEFLFVNIPGTVAVSQIFKEETPILNICDSLWNQVKNELEKV